MAAFSLVIGILVFGIMLLGIVPLLGWLNWFNIPLAVLGFALALISILGGKTKTSAIAGLILNLVALTVGALRLLIGGGII